MAKRSDMASMSSLKSIMGLQDGKYIDSWFFPQLNDITIHDAVKIDLDCAVITTTMTTTMTTKIYANINLSELKLSMNFFQIMAYGIKPPGMNKSYFILALLCLGANSCQDASIKASDMQLAEMQKSCVKPSHYNIEVENPNYVFGEPLRFRIPADHNVKLSYEQNTQQKTNTPPDIFCTQSEMRFLKVETLKLIPTQSRTGSIAKGEKSITPKGVYNITLPSSHKLRCSKPPGASKTNHLRFAHVAAETCRMSSTLPDSNLNFNYYIQTYPSDHVNGGSLETENWPYKFYPRETWSMLEEDITTYLSNLLYEDLLKAN